jgi:hypothetical protein
MQPVLTQRFLVEHPYGKISVKTTGKTLFLNTGFFLFPEPG